MSTSPACVLKLPWSSSGEDGKFKKILIALMLLYVAIALPIAIIKLPELTRAEKEQLPPQLARIMLEKQELPAPKPLPKPIEKLKEEPKKVLEKTLEEKKLIEKNSIDKKIMAPPEKIISDAQNKLLDKTTQQQAAVAQARERAANSGLMQFKDDLMEMRESLQMDAVETASTNTATTANTAKKVDRAMLTSGAITGSGGVNTGAYSRDTGGQVLSGRAATKVKSGLAEASNKAAGASAGGGANSDGAGGAARSEEEVRKVMEQHKGAIFTIYNKALRDDATLQGKVVVKMVIDPDGRIIEATIVSSALQSPELETKLLQRIKLITFSKSNVIRTTLNYSFDFLPR